MKALYATAPGEYDLADRPKPAPGVGEALVKVARTGFCMNDVRVREGVLRHGYPVIPGHQFAGVVEACGPEVHYRAAGDRVAVHSYVLCGQCLSCRKGGVHDCDNFRILGFTLDGGLAEYCVAPARCLFKLPDEVTLEEGSLMENLASAVRGGAARAAGGGGTGGHRRRHTDRAVGRCRWPVWHRRRRW